MIFNRTALARYTLNALSVTIKGIGQHIERTQTTALCLRNCSKTSLTKRSTRTCGPAPKETNQFPIANVAISSFAHGAKTDTAVPKLFKT